MVIYLATETGAEWVVRGAVSEFRRPASDPRGDYAHRVGVYYATAEQAEFARATRKWFLVDAADEREALRVVNRTECWPEENGTPGEPVYSGAVRLGRIVDSGGPQ